MSEKPITGVMKTNWLKWALLAVPFCCSGCLVLSHDYYYTPATPHEHRMASPFPGNPWNSDTCPGSPPDIITLESDGVEIGLSVRNSASTFGWVGPWVVPLIPIPVRENPEASRLEIWIALEAHRDAGARLDDLRIRLPRDDSVLAPSQTTMAPAETRQIPAGTSLSAYLHFPLPEPAVIESFELVISGITTAKGPLDPMKVEYSRVRGWRVISLP